MSALSSFLFLIAFLWSYPILAFSRLSQAEKSVAEGDYRQAVEIYKNLIQNKEESSESEPLELKLALAYLKDQDQEAAFKTFLDLLEKTKGKSSSATNAEEEALYQDALQLYLSHKEGGFETAKKICEKYDPIVRMHAQMHSLALILAAAYANLNQYETFFELFYPAYRCRPNHFLADKAKAALHIKLFERSRTHAERELHRAAILSLFSRALEKEPRDESLYKFLVLFAASKDRAATLHRCLNKIIDNNIIISRGDVAFYIEKALESDDLPLAQRLVDKACEWYQYSRVIQTARQYLDKQRNN
jgi:hypothetical protein